MSLLIRHGPCSWKTPTRPDPPGYQLKLAFVQTIPGVAVHIVLTPPCSHSVSGAVSGFSRASKNQNLQSHDEYVHWQKGQVY